MKRKQIIISDEKFLKILKAYNKYVIAFFYDKYKNLNVLYTSGAKILFNTDIMIKYYAELTSNKSDSMANILISRDIFDDKVLLSFYNNLQNIDYNSDFTSVFSNKVNSLFDVLELNKYDIPTSDVVRVIM